MDRPMTIERQILGRGILAAPIALVWVLICATTSVAAQLHEPSAEGEIAGVENPQQQPVPLSIVVARQVMLLEGRVIITWPELAERIAALPDPSLAHPSYYVTRGAREAGREQDADAEMWKLHQKFQLRGHSEGSLWAQADLRYDRIGNADDLNPDEGLRVSGMIIDKDGQPVADAEVLLIRPIDQSIAYKTWHIALVHGGVRNRLEHEMTDSDPAGRFTLYPPKNDRYYIVAMHVDAGFALVSSDETGFAANHAVTLVPWAGLIAKLEKELGEDHEASIKTTIPAREGFPDVVIDQYWSDQKSDLPADFFGFTHVPPIFETSLSRTVPEGEGESIGLPGAKVTLRPGEIRRLDVGPLTDEQREQLQNIRRYLREQRG